MFAIAARKMGYRVHAYEAAPDSPAGQVSDLEVCAPYDDLESVARFARGVDVVTFEFENIPLAAVEAAAAIVPVRPAGRALHICQNREREKNFLRDAGFPCAGFEVVTCPDTLAAALARIGTPSVLKTADFGYDGKGQLKLAGRVDPVSTWKAFGGGRAVLEQFVPFEAELSVVVARGLDGAVAAFPVCENIHTRHILDLTIVPGRFSEATGARAVNLAGQIARELDIVGLLAVEMFLLADGEILVNELAPRPHNSGHFSFDACVTSQFEQQLRAVCGLPLGSTELLAPAVMKNLLGDLWGEGEPGWPALLANPALKLHLYGKSEARPGRKMGHLCLLGNQSESLAFLEAAFRRAPGDPA